ncbi:SUF system Fe-S cluster assembly protein [Commensalibacter oyaizuii]|uniref:SUF system Fe-S cluster assembly protein n=1 Tax=Commensalibacter oyaizuii TaxID=3043873 RepID=A0ABT6PZV4_9PROT|nr:SUF system Fe-S cluster assembly protein [Commensalibacter sp. TBRC 16381]MDI2090394.1 SUF system Fe-S cluster assembly protein [Commensalibacter sp. TBRC 16381]
MKHIETSLVNDSNPASSSENIAQELAKRQDCVDVWTPDNEGNKDASQASKTHSIDENAIIDAISTVYDPEIPVNVYELGLIYAIDLHDDGRINVEMTLTAPNCPSAQELPVMIQQAIEKVPGVTQVQVNVVWDPPWDVSRMSDEARLTLNMF